MRNFHPRFSGPQPKQGTLAAFIYLGFVFVFVQFRTQPPIEEIAPSFARLVLEVLRISDVQLTIRIALTLLI